MNRIHDEIKPKYMRQYKHNMYLSLCFSLSYVICVFVYVDIMCYSNYVFMDHIVKELGYYCCVSVS